MIRLMNQDTLQRGFAEAAQAFQDGQFQPCIAKLKTLMAVAPDNPDLLHLYGLTLCQTGKTGTGIMNLDRAVETGANPLHARSLAIVLRGQGERDKAIAVLRTLHNKNPRSGLCGLLGVLLQETGQLEAAAQAYGEATQANPRDGEAALNLAFVQTELGYNAAAEGSYVRALELKPDSVRARTNLGQLLEEKGQYEAAQQVYETGLAGAREPALVNALARVRVECGEAQEGASLARQAHHAKPDWPEPLLVLGAAAQAEEDYDQAVEYYRKALALKPDLPAGKINLGILLQQMGQLDEARALFVSVMIGHPDSFDAHYNLGLVLHDLGEFDAATSAFAQALEIRPGDADARFSSSFTKLMKGEFKAAFEAYEARWDVRERKAGRLPEKPLAGLVELPKGAGGPDQSLLILAEQGFGDQILFSRYLPRATEKFADVCLLSTEPLARLLEASFKGRCSVVTRINEAFAGGFDYELTLASLPNRLALGADQLFDFEPWLAAPAELAQTWATTLGQHDRPRIGIVWSGNPRLKRLRRGLSLDHFRPLFALGTAQWISLQVGDAAGEITPDDSAHLLDLSAEITDFADTAAIMEACDLIISVDTAAANLAGALGKTVWVLNRFQSDWRYGRGQEATPWFPTMRIFSQPQPGAWDEPLAKVADELAKFLKS